MNAFWSVTMYDGKTQLLIKNPINRYLINSPMLKLKKNADGSLTIYVQKETPAGQGIQLAARTGRPDLSGDAPLLAEGPPPSSCRPGRERGVPPALVASK